MTVQTLTLGKNKFVVVPEREFDRLRRENAQYRAMLNEDRRLGKLAEKELKAHRKSGRKGTAWEAVKNELGL